MKNKAALLMVVLLMADVCRADFKYTETSKITGGSMMGMMKMVSVFSKSARQANQAQTTTMAVKSNRLRHEKADGNIEIIDLDGKRFIEIDSKAKTYSILTFEQMRQNMERARERMKEEQAKAAAKHPEAAKTNVKITPKIESSETGATRNLLGLDTKEVKTRIEMQMETDDPRAQGQQMSTVINSDQWIAPTVPGYDEIRQFYVKMAKEMDWVPGALSGAMANSNVQIGMTELRKNNARVNGIPLLQTVSISMSGNAPAGQGLGQGPGQGQAQGMPTAPPPQQQPEQPNMKEEATKAIATGMLGPAGGMLVGLAHRKKKPAEPPPQPPAADTTAGAAPATPPPAAAPSGPSLMDTTIEVTSYSNSALDKSLFDVPAGYVQVQPDPNKTFGGKQ